MKFQRRFPSQKQIADNVGAVVGRELGKAAELGFDKTLLLEMDGGRSHSRKDHGRDSHRQA